MSELVEVMARAIKSRWQYGSTPYAEDLADGCLKALCREIGCSKEVLEGVQRIIIGVIAHLERRHPKKSNSTRRLSHDRSLP